MNLRLSLCLVVVVLAGCAQTSPPQFRVDPNWPQPLAEENGVQLVMGQVAGIAVNEKNGHVWIVHRPSTLLADEWHPKENRPVTHRCCKSLPPVVEFDASGKYVRGWGPSGPQVQWPKTEHGIHVDPEGNVWIAGNGNEDHQILKFRPDGQLLMQIGRPGKSEGSNSREQLGRPAHMVLSGRELFVADGYGNPVHCVRVSNDGKVYVCDRVNNRIQVFGKGGEFQGEFRVEVETRANGSVWDMVLSHDAAQKYMYVADGANGRMAGEFKWIHNIAIDRDGNLYTAEVGFGRRIQKFVRNGGAF